MKIILDRVGEDDEQTYGVLKIGEGGSFRPRFVTCEDLWKGNQRNLSCIPVGTYRCVEHESPAFGWTYLVTCVPGRSHILFHPGNSHEDTRGCILVGSSYASEYGGSGIVGSRVAFGKFLRLLRDVREFELTIRNLVSGASL